MEDLTITEAYVDAIGSDVGRGARRGAAKEGCLFAIRVVHSALLGSSWEPGSTKKGRPANGQDGVQRLGERRDSAAVSGEPKASSRQYQTRPQGYESPTAIANARQDRLRAPRGAADSYIPAGWAQATRAESSWLRPPDKTCPFSKGIQ